VARAPTVLVPKDWNPDSDRSLSNLNGPLELQDARETFRMHNVGLYFCPVFPFSFLLYSSLRSFLLAIVIKCLPGTMVFCYLLHPIYARLHPTSPHLSCYLDRTGRAVCQRDYSSPVPSSLSLIPFFFTALTHSHRSQAADLDSAESRLSYNKKRLRSAPAESGKLDWVRSWYDSDLCWIRCGTLAGRTNSNVERSSLAWGELWSWISVLIHGPRASADQCIFIQGRIEAYDSWGSARENQDPSCDMRSGRWSADIVRGSSWKRAFKHVGVMVWTENSQFSQFIHQILQENEVRM
jgi:hypothetical protein